MSTKENDVDWDSLGISGAFILDEEKKNMTIKKYKVSGTWHHYFLANDATEANKHAQHTISGINLPNITLNVQHIDEEELKGNG